MYKQLKEIATIYNGNSINAKVKANKYSKSVPGWNYIGTKDISSDGKVNYNTGVIIPFDEAKFKTAPKNSVFVCSEGGNAGRKTAHINQEVCFGNKLYAIVNEKNLFNSKYVFFYTQYREFFEQFKSLMTGIIGGVSLKKFGEIKVPLPSLEEQQRIVTKIEELFSKLDNGVEELNKIKEQLKVYRQAELKNSYSKVGGNYCKLKEICDFITKGTTPPKESMTLNSGDIPYIKVYNLTFNGTLDFTVDPTFVDENTHKTFLSRSIVKPGDVLMNIVGPPLGKVSIVPDLYDEWNINQAVARFRCKDCINNKYLLYFLLYADTVEKQKNKAKATAGQLNLTLEICRNIEIPLPDIDVQKNLTKKIESRLSVCDKIEQTVNESLQKAESLRQSILKQAFEGKLV